MSKKEMIIGIALIGILVLVIIVLRSRPHTPEQEKTDSSQPETISAVDVSDWLTYESKEYGYRFKYPKDAEIIVDRKDSRYDVHGSSKPQATVVVLPAQYPNFDQPDYKNPQTFENYMITVGWEGPSEGLGKTDDKIAQHFVASYGEIAEINKTTDKTIAVYGEGEQAILLEKDNVYYFSLVGRNPNEQHVQEWLKDIGDVKLTESVNHYPDYLRILTGMYSTFETF